MVRFIEWMRRVLLIVVVLMLMGEGTALAYTVWGPKWPNHKATYKLTSYFSAQGPGWQQRAQNAAANWNAVNSTAFSFQKVSTSGNKIDASDTIQSCNCLARTTMTANGNTMTKFIMQVNTNSGYAFYDGTQAPQIPSNYYDLRSVIRHELGHALGLCHSNNGNGPYLMSTQISTGVIRSVDTDAKNGLRYLYQSSYSGPDPSGACIP